MRELADGLMTVFLVAVAYRDWKTRRIPIILLLVLSVFAVLFQVTILHEEVGQILGGVLIGLGFVVVSKCTNEAIGYGDSWLILILGIYLGSGKVLEILLAAGFGASLFSLWKLCQRGWNKRITIPFAPFLVAAYIGAIYL